MVRRRSHSQLCHTYDAGGAAAAPRGGGRVTLLLFSSNNMLLTILLVMTILLTTLTSFSTGFRCSTTPVFHHGGGQRLGGGGSVALRGGQRTSSFIAPLVVLRNKASSTTRTSSSSSTSLSMFMGSDGGLLGIGTPEVFTILLVGYFVLGPSDLYKLVKEIGKFIQNIRTMGTDLTTSFENNMESQLQLEELRKAQRELNEAFSFRRSINTNPNEQEAFSTTVETPREPSVLDASTMAATAATATGGAAATAAPKKMRRKKVVIKKRPSVAETNPDSLEMPDTGTTPVTTTAATKKDRPMDPFIRDSSGYTKEEEDAINADFDKYTLGTGADDNDDDDDAYDNTWNKYSDYGLAPTPAVPPPKQEQSRFQQQLSGTWNENVLSNEKELAPPVAQIMQLLAVLEEEKIAATKRLEEEFRKRAEMDEAYYQKQRQLLKDASIQEQQQQQAPVQEAQKTE